MTIDSAAERLGDAPTLPATIADDARKVDPREVAKLFNMSPQPATAYRVDGDRRHVVALCHHSGRESATADVAHGSSGQFCAPMTFAALRGSMPVLVRDVFRLSAPCEVCGAVVRARAIEVAHDVVRWARPMKRGADKSGNTTREPMTIRAHDKAPITVLVEPTTEGSIGVDAFDLPVTGNTVLGRLLDYPPRRHESSNTCATISWGGPSINLPRGTVVYADVPYKDTTGYAHAFPRSEWIPIVRRWQEAGAMVVVSEAEPIPELMADGWHAVRIDGERKGQKRTFSKQQAEWLTMSEPPRWRPSVQMGLWSRGSV